QNQRFSLVAGAETHWTEAYGALDLDPRVVHGRGYQEAVAAVADAIEQRFPQAELAEIDTFLSEMSKRPVTRRIATGSAWGSRHERLAGRRLASGLDFSAPPSGECWDDLLDHGRFSDRSLAEVPQEFAVSARWVEALRLSVVAQGG